MVYCGKPSKSCRQCRNRNIKCDKKLPSCGQCIRAKLSCPGYHNPSTLIIRDQTSSTILKTQRLPPSSITAPRKSTIPPTPDIPIAHHAKHLFILHHVFGIGSAGIPLTLSYMKAFYPPSPTDFHFTSTLRAVSLAYLSSVSSSSSILQEARRHYNIALQLTNQCLRNSETVMADSTLFTVLMLHLFERFSRREGGEMEREEAERKHLEGAMALVRLRGEGQFRGEVGVSMFHHLSEKILMRCLERGTAVPKDYFVLRRQAKMFVDLDVVEWRLEELMIRCVALGDSCSSGEMKRGEVLDLMRCLEKEIYVVTRGMPKDPGYDRMLTRQLEMLFPQGRTLQNEVPSSDAGIKNSPWGSTQIDKALLVGKLEVSNKW